MRKRVYIAYTGGTVGMTNTTDGYTPTPGYLAEQMASMPELRDAAMPTYTIHEYNPLLDSSNMTPSDWLTIAQDIAEHYEDYDGFIVLHGTDTMAYSASALAFMLEGLTKTVILTGSQIPLCEIRNDGRENLITSLLIAAQFTIPEVCLYFGNALFRGCRSVKVYSDGLAAFASPNFPPLGRAGITIDINWNLVRPPSPPPEQLTIHPMNRPIVGALRLFPGISASMIQNMLLPPLVGLVLETYGVGNAPEQDQQFLAALRDAIERGVVIVNCTQCIQGMVDMGNYATGSALAKIGVVSGLDMTAEAALTKMFYLFSKGYTPAQVTRAMQTDLRGELTALAG